MRTLVVEYARVLKTLHTMLSPSKHDDEELWWWWCDDDNDYSLMVDAEERKQMGGKEEAKTLLCVLLLEDLKEDDGRFGDEHVSPQRHRVDLQPFLEKHWG